MTVEHLAGICYETVQQYQRTRNKPASDLRWDHAPQKDRDWYRQAVTARVEGKPGPPSADPKILGLITVLIDFFRADLTI